MNKWQHHRQLPTNIVIGLLVLVLLIILAFGLTPKHLSSDNHVSRLTGSPGLVFGHRGIAYTRPLLETTTDKISPENEFSVEISLNPTYQEGGGFRFIMTLHNGEERDQLLVGQWKSHIVVMNGDDYSYQRKIKRISVDTAALPEEDLILTVTTGKSGTKIYANGELLREKADLRLTIPAGQKGVRLVLGNSVYGNNAWEGVIHGLAFYPYELTAQQISRHHDQWARDRNFSFAMDAHPYLLYLFNENDERKALDHGRRNHHIHMPAKMKTLERKYLSLPKGTQLSGWPVRDMLLNLAGFIPFGFILSAALTRYRHIHGNRCLMVTILVGFILSLTIESCQAWIPTRYSSILDLVLNTFGTMIGAVLYKTFCMPIIEDPKADAPRTPPHVCPHTISIFLDNWFRRLIQSPKKIVGPYIHAGDTVIDIGCGPGFFSIEMARMVGESGRVIAVDLQEKMIGHVKRKAAKHGMTDRMVFHQCQSDRIGLDLKADFILAYYMVHETPRPLHFLEETRRMLKDEGRLLVVEPKMHVSRKVFRQLLEDAAAAGLKTVEFPRRKGGRSVLFGC